MGFADQLRKNKIEGLESGLWFSTVPENVGIEFVGVVERFFDYKVEGKTRKAFSLRVIEDSVGFTQVTGSEAKGNRQTEKVTAEIDTIVNFDYSGQLKFVMDQKEVGPGTIALIQYMGKDENVEIQGNHPHTWAYSFIDAGAVSG